jgi:hypothetical protein
MFQSFFTSFIMVFTTITTLFRGVNSYAQAFEKSGIMVDNYVDDAVQLQKLEHAKRMEALRNKATEQGVNLEID